MLSRRMDAKHLDSSHPNQLGAVPRLVDSELRIYCFLSILPDLIIYIQTNHNVFEYIDYLRI